MPLTRRLSLGTLSSRLFTKAGTSLYWYALRSRRHSTWLVITDWSCGASVNCPRRTRIIETPAQGRSCFPDSAISAEQLIPKRTVNIADNWKLFYLNCSINLARGLLGNTHADFDIHSTANSLYIISRRHVSKENHIVLKSSTSENISKELILPSKN